LMQVRVASHGERVGTMPLFTSLPTTTIPGDNVAIIPSRDVPTTVHSLLFLLDRALQSLLFQAAYFSLALVLILYSPISFDWIAVQLS
jgi:hypothetical protein